MWVDGENRSHVGFFKAHAKQASFSNGLRTCPASNPQQLIRDLKAKIQGQIFHPKRDFRGPSRDAGMPLSRDVLSLPPPAAHQVGPQPLSPHGQGCDSTGDQGLSWLACMAQQHLSCEPLHPKPSHPPGGAPPQLPGFAVKPEHPPETPPSSGTTQPNVQRLLLSLGELV